MESKSEIIEFRKLIDKMTDAEYDKFKLKRRDASKSEWVNIANKILGKNKLN